MISLNFVIHKPLLQLAAQLVEMEFSPKINWARSGVCSTSRMIAVSGISFDRIEWTMLYSFHTGLGRCSYYCQSKWGLMPDHSYGCGTGVEAMEHFIN